jgi:SDR family mycofactocin-dependent oxidoreductase
MARLDGKVVLITGAARGQGRAHALTLAREGADIIGIDMGEDLATVPYELARPDELDETAAQVEELGRRALFLKADVRQQDQLDEVVERGISEFGQIDVLIANAGIYSQAPFWEMSDDMWNDMIDINLTGVWRSAKAVAPHMISRRQGSLVLTSSINGFQPGYQLSHYVAAKHGVIGLMRNFANELAPYDIRCNAVCPGAVDTTMLNNPPQYERFAGKADGTREEAIESVRHFHLLHGRSMLPPEAVSRGILWLVSDDAADVTGVALPIDAGHLAMDGFNPNPTK